MPDNSNHRPPIGVHEAAVERLFVRDQRTQVIVPDDALAAAAAALRAARLTNDQLAETAAALHRHLRRFFGAVRAKGGVCEVVRA